MHTLHVYHVYIIIIPYLPRCHHTPPHCRPAHQGQLSDHMPTLGIPSDIPWSHLPSANHPFYFCTLRHATPADKQGRSLIRKISASTNQSDQPSDVVLGPVLGRGSFGKVYRAVWRGTPVAVKIMQYTTGNGHKGRATEKQLEDIAGVKVVHPNIVPTYKIFTRVVEVGCVTGVCVEKHNFFVCFVLTMRVCVCVCVRVVPCWYTQHSLLNTTQQHEPDAHQHMHDGSWGPLAKGLGNHHMTPTPSDKDSAAGMFGQHGSGQHGTGMHGLRVSSLAVCVLLFF